MKWYEKYPERLKEEENYIKVHNESEYAYGLRCGISNSGLFNYIFHIKVKGEEITALCIYPYQYPYQRIVVILYKDYKPYIKGFHNTNGSLCLFGHQPDGWEYHYGIKEIIQKVKDWFLTGQYNFENVIPEGYDDNHNVYIISKEITNLKEGIGIFTYKQPKDRCELRIIDKIEIRNNPILELKNSLFSLFTDYNIGKGILIVTNKSKWINYDNENNTLSHISSYINSLGGSKRLLSLIQKEGISFPCPLMVIYKNYNYQGNVFEVLENKDIEISKYVLFEDEKSLFNRTGNEEYEDLENKTVMIVGIGSIGSQLAIQLAKSGVKKFILIDYQKLEIENIIKHELSLKDIHRYKTKAIKDKLIQINPNISCITFEEHIENQGFIDKILMEHIRKSNIIISTIDDKNASYILDGLCLQLNKSVIYVNAFYMARSGVIAFSNKKMACLDCLTEQIENMKEKLPNFNLGITEDYQCRNNSYVAGQNYNLSIVNFGTRIVLKYLTNKMPKDEEGYIYNCYFIGNEEMKSLDGKEFFTDEITVKRFAMPGNKGCCVCGDG